MVWSLGHQIEISSNGSKYHFGFPFAKLAIQPFFGRVMMLAEIAGTTSRDNVGGYRSGAIASRQGHKVIGGQLHASPESLLMTAVSTTTLPVVNGEMPLGYRKVIRQRSFSGFSTLITNADLYRFLSSVTRLALAYLLRICLVPTFSAFSSSIGMRFIVSASSLFVFFRLLGACETSTFSVLSGIIAAVFTYSISIAGFAAVLISRRLMFTWRELRQWLLDTAMRTTSYRGGIHDVSLPSHSMKLAPDGGIDRFSGATLDANHDYNIPGRKGGAF